MKACREWQDAIVEYVDGRCAPEKARKLESHLSTCEACAAVVREHRRLKLVVAQIPSVHTPAHLTRRIRDRARVERQRQLKSQWLVKFSFAAIGAALLAAALWWKVAPHHLPPSLPPDEPTLAQAIVQEYVGTTTHDAFSDPSLQMLARDAQMKVVQEEPISQ